MTKNVKIALGCGGAGCLGLIVVVGAVAVLIFTGFIKAPGIYSPNSNHNYNYNRNSNFNSNFNANSNENSNTNDSPDSSSSSMSDDAKHKLYQAAGMSKDTDLMIRVMKKVGLGDGTGANHQQFVKEHFAWALKNMDFISSLSTPEKARAYVAAHMDD